MTSTAKVAVIGLGNAGLAVAARLQRQSSIDVTGFDARSTHRYSPLNSFIGAGLAHQDQALKPQASVNPKGMRWVREPVNAVDPHNRVLTTSDGSDFRYDIAIVCPGVQPDFSAIPGVEDAIAARFAASNYDFDLAPQTWELIRSVTSGVALFTSPSSRFPCPGAAQKILYMACDYWRSRGTLGRIKPVFVTGDRYLCAEPLANRGLLKVAREFGIDVRYHCELTYVEGQTATIEDTESGSITSIRTAMMHVVPPHRPPAWIAESELADGTGNGYVDVAAGTLQHRLFDAVFALGDAAKLPVESSGAGLRHQAPVVAANVRARASDAPLPRRYEGYDACPFTVTRSKVLFAEYGPTGAAMPSTPSPIAKLRYGKPSRLAFIFDRYVLPRVYYQLIIRGLA